MKLLSKIVSIQPEEKSPVLLLLAHSFFLGVFIAYFFSYANGAFVGEIGVKWLPVAYIISGVAGYLTSLVYGRLQRNVAFARLVRITLYFLLVMSLLFYVALLQFGEANWLVFLTFIWVGPFLGLISLQFWGMTMKLFDLRQGKRLFSLIGSGDVISSILGFVSVKYILEWLTTYNEVGEPLHVASYHLILLSVIGIGGALLFQYTILGKYKTQMAAGDGVKKKEGPKGSMKEMFQNRYYKFIFFLILFSIIGSYFVDYTFLGIAKQRYAESPAQLTAFIGLVFAVIKTFELTSKLFFAGKLLNRFGVKLGLLLLPTCLLIFTFLGIAAAFWAGAIFFICFLVNKIFDRAIRRSIEEPAFKVLYQPLDANTRIMVQTQAEGKAKQIAVVVAGGLLALVGLAKEPEVQEVTQTIGEQDTAFPLTIYIAAGILALVLIAWFFASRRLVKEYRHVLVNKLDTGKTAFQVMSKGANIFEKGLFHGDEIVVLNAIKVLEQLSPGAANYHLPPLLEHASPAVRKQVALMIGEKKMMALHQQIKSSVKTEQEEDVRAALERIDQEFNQLAEASGTTIEQWINSNNPLERLNAASVLVSKGDEDGTLMRLMQDEDERVLLKLVNALHGSNRLRFLELLARHLDDPQLGNVVYEILCREDEKVVPVLGSMLKRNNEDIPLLLRIISILEKTGSAEGCIPLKEKLDHYSIGVRQATLRALSTLGYKANDDFLFVKQKILRETDYCSWLISSIIDLQEDEETFEIMHALEGEYIASRGRIFTYLSFIYKASSIQQIQQVLEGKDGGNEALAIEMADVLLAEELKDYIFPLIDSLSYEAKKRALNDLFPQMEYSSEKRLLNVLFYDYAQMNAWIKVTALGIIAKKQYKHTPYEVIATAHSKELVLKEAAYLALYQLDLKAFHRTVAYEKEEFKYHVKRILQPHSKGHVLSVMERTKILKRSALFVGVPDMWLVKIAEHLHEAKIDVKGQLRSRYGNNNNVHVVVSGSLEISNGEQSVYYLSSDVFGVIEDLNLAKCTLDVVEDTHLLYMNKKQFYDFVLLIAPLAQNIYQYEVQNNALGQSVHITY